MTAPRQTCALCGRVEVVTPDGRGFPPDIAKRRLKKACKAAGCPSERNTKLASGSPGRPDLPASRHHKTRPRAPQEPTMPPHPHLLKSAEEVAE